MPNYFNYINCIVRIIFLLNLRLLVLMLLNLCFVLKVVFLSFFSLFYWKAQACKAATRQVLSALTVLLLYMRSCAAILFSPYHFIISFSWISLLRLLVFLIILFINFALFKQRSRSLLGLLTCWSSFIFFKDFIAFSFCKFSFLF